AGINWIEENNKCRRELKKINRLIHENKSDVLNFQYAYECVEGRYLTYKLEQISSSPYVVKVVNIGEKKNIDVMSITFETGKLTIKSLMTEKGKKLPDKYIHTWKGIEIGTHIQAVARIALPNFMSNVVEATNNNMISPQWMFVATLLQRLRINYDSLTDRAICEEFTGSDVAWTFAECVRLSEGNNLPPQVIKMFKAEFNRIPEDIRKPFEVVNAEVSEVKETKHKPISITRPLNNTEKKQIQTDPRANLTKQYKTADKEQELRHIVYRASDLPEQKVEKLRSQAFKSNGELRDFKTPGGYVGGTKKTKSKIASGGKSTNNTNIPVFDKGQKFYHEKLKRDVQLIVNTNSGIIELINYQTGKAIVEVGKILNFDGEKYNFSLYQGINKLVPNVVKRVNSLIQPKLSDDKGDINLQKLKILDGLKQQQIQKVTEEKHGYHITGGTISKVRSKAWKYLSSLANQESHPLYKHLKSENWQEVFTICASLGLISK
ncbi:MAG TPA: hypothetical protein DCP31_31240, partial [Cyanobacteria bacterium UBA8543]|nr:hypothetical protein [Cyanobacteria bacterium UBA8543]